MNNDIERDQMNGNDNPRSLTVSLPPALRDVINASLYASDSIGTEFVGKTCQHTVQICKDCLRGDALLLRLVRSRAQQENTSRLANAYKFRPDER